MFGTPDFGHSDIWHFNFALKYFLSQALRAGHLPAWSKDIGTGFPLLAEGQIGAGNLYNLTAFRLLDPVLAFNIGFIVIFATIASGSYLYARTIKLSRLSSLFLAIIFSFSGVFVTQIVHFNLIQAASFLPWLFFATEKYWQTNRKRFLVLFSLVLTQQIYSGFQQMVMISLFGLAIYALLRRRPFSLVFPIIIGAFLALPQLLISAQLVQESFRAGGVPIAEMIKYPFPPVHLLSFLNPFVFGDPHLATYPSFGNNWGIFWESTGYIGLLPLILVVKDLKRFKENLVFWVILIVSLVLMLGKFTPLFFVFQIPPLSLFRVPARFLILFVWSLAILAAISFNRIKKKWLAVAIFSLSLADILFFASKYNAVIDPKVWLAKPESVQILEKDKSWFRISSFFPYASWNAVYLNEGWQNMADFLPLRNSLDPNQNLFWQIPSVDVYAGLTPKRMEIWRSLLDTGITRNRLTDASVKLLSLSGVKYVITPWPLDKFELVATPSSKPQILIYKNPAIYPHAYLTRNYLVARDIPDLVKKLTDPESQAVILEKDPNIFPYPDSPNPVAVTKNEDLEVDIQAQSTVSAILVLSDSYYPGWQAFINNKPIEILPANLNQRAIVIPEGSWEIRFVYRPWEIH